MTPTPDPIGGAVKTTKHDRCGHANRVLDICSIYGRRFFRNYTDGEVSRFEVDTRGHIWLIDKDTKRRIYVMDRDGPWRGFTEGGTLRRLCEDLRDYIRTGTLISRGHFGPWPQWRADGDIWGYGPEMELVRQAVFKLPCVRPPANTEEAA